MSKFHNTVSRRTFMKGLGLAGAGLGAAAATAPVFHDLDEVLSSPGDAWKNPWWVKERDFENPTVEVDWSVYKRWDRNLMNSDPAAIAAAEARTMALIEGTYGTTDRDVLRKRWAQDKLPGMSHRDWSLRNAIKSVKNGAKDDYNGVDFEYLGISKWQGTPEENTKMLRVASRFFGAYWSGVMEINATSKKVIYAKNGNRVINFKDVDEYSRTDTEYIYPNKYSQAFNWITQHPQSALGTSPGYINNPYGYFFATNVRTRIRQFIENLGYGQASAQCGSGSMATLSGVTEMCRMGAPVIVPSAGAMPRVCQNAMTDLPLAPTPPIDAGIFKFCKSCKKCAEVCFTNSLSMEAEPSWETTGLWNIPGLKHYYSNYKTCGPFKSTYAPGYCGTCMAVCTFRKGTEAAIHEVVQGIATTTTIFNPFFRKMDDFFGYSRNLLGAEAHTNDDYVDEWWNTIGPELGFLTHFGAWNR